MNALGSNVTVSNPKTTAAAAALPSARPAAEPAPSAGDHVTLSGNRHYEAMTPMSTNAYAQIVDPLSNTQVGLTRGVATQMLAVPQTDLPGRSVVLLKDMNGDNYYEAADPNKATA